MSSRKIRYWDSSSQTTVTSTFTFDKSKRYKWNKSTGAVEEVTTQNALADDELTVAGSKSSLRRIGDLERNVSILASKAGVAGADNVDTDAVLKNSSRALRSYTPITTSNDTITLHLGDGSTASASIADANTWRGISDTPGNDSATSISRKWAMNAFVGASVNNDTITFTKGDGTTTSVTTSDANSNTYVTGASFNTTDGVLTLTRNSGSVTVDLDGRYVTSSGVTSHTVGAGAGLTGGGTVTSTGTTTLNVGAGNGITVAADAVAMSGSFTGTFTASGDICAYSDERLKENVEVIGGALDKVAAVRGVTFDRKEDGVRSTGVIAQELQKVLPEAVREDEDGMLNVAYGNVVGLLIEAIKELKAEIEELKK